MLTMTKPWNGTKEKLYLYMTQSHNNYWEQQHLADVLFDTRRDSMNPSTSSSQRTWWRTLRLPRDFMSIAFSCLLECVPCLCLVDRRPFTFWETRSQPISTLTLDSWLALIGHTRRVWPASVTAAGLKVSLATHMYINVYCPDSPLTETSLAEEELQTSSERWIRYHGGKEVYSCKYICQVSYPTSICT